MNIVDAHFLLKAKDPAMEIVLRIFAGPPSSDTWTYELRKPWPCEDGIFSPPWISNYAHSRHTVAGFLKAWADLKHPFTSKIYRAVQLGTDPIEHWGALLYNDIAWDAEDI